jgi:hypothetical protein
MEIKPISNYAYLSFWTYFNWELYVKVIEAKMAESERLNIVS